MCRFHLDVLAVLQLEAPCQAVATVQPQLRSAPPSPDPKAAAHTAHRSSAHNALAASSAANRESETVESGEEAPLQLPPLAVVGAQGGLLLLEIISDPALQEADMQVLHAAHSAHKAAQAAATAHPAQALDADCTMHEDASGEGGDACTEGDAMARRRRAVHSIGSGVHDGAGTERAAPAAGARAELLGMRSAQHQNVHGTSDDGGARQAAAQADSGEAGASVHRSQLLPARDWRQHVQVRSRWLCLLV